VATWPTLHVSEHPAVRHKLGILRDEKTEPKKFREVVRELSWLLGYEALADARMRPVEVKTPLEAMEGEELADRIGLIPILRAGLGMVDAMLELMPTAEVWHLGLFRDERTLRPVEYYNKLPDHSHVDLCLILDPMLATGGSATQVTASAAPATRAGVDPRDRRRHEASRRRATPPARVRGCAGPGRGPPARPCPARSGRPASARRARRRWRCRGTA
jgi:uracil phosphoribosyltransferase